MKYEVITGNCEEVMETLANRSIHAVLTDPPYFLTNNEIVYVEMIKAWCSDEKWENTRKARGFMGRDWDGYLPGPEVWKLVKQKCTPGAHVMAMGGDRTFDILSVAMRLAGIERRASISLETVLRWYYKTGFPKSHNISMAIDKELGVEREKVVVPAREVRNPKSMNGGHGVQGADRPYMREAQEKGFHEMTSSEPVSDEAKEWAGWGTGLKPYWEAVLLSRCPLEGTVASNVMEHGTGGMNLAACRPEGDGPGNGGGGWMGKNGFTRTHGASCYGGMGAGDPREVDGCWPPNMIAVHLEDCTRFRCLPGCPVLELENGGIESRFMYCPKPHRKEKDAGLEGEGLKTFSRVNSGGMENDPKWQPKQVLNDHETVKPISLFRYLAKLICPPGGTILDPFCGSGTTGCAAVLEGFNFIGIELRPDMADIARKRIAYWDRQPVQETLF